MKKQDMQRLIEDMPKDKEIFVHNEEDFDVFLLRPSVLSERFKDYDVDKNFQIWLLEKKHSRKFRPNHLRVFIDLNLRVRSRPDLTEKLLEAFDQIFKGEDPEIQLKELSKEKFDFELNKIEIIGVLSQLFIIEQEYGYNKDSKYDPPSLFYQGWVREFIDNPKEIDNLCMSVSRGQPPTAKYVNVENKKSRKYDLLKLMKPLWYLDEQ